MEEDISGPGIPCMTSCLVFLRIHREEHHLGCFLNRNEPPLLALPLCQPPILMLLPRAIYCNDAILHSTPCTKAKVKSPVKTAVLKGWTSFHLCRRRERFCCTKIVLVGIGFNVAPMYYTMLSCLIALCGTSVLF